MPSRQRAHGGGKFKSEKQRRFLWANFNSAAKKWAHNRSTNKSDWRRSGGKKRRTRGRKRGGRGRRR